MQNNPSRDAELTQVFTRRPATQVAPREPLDHDDRKRRLDERVHDNIVRGGARVESRSDYQAVLVRGRRPNHVLHLLLTIVTLGVWALVWIGVASSTGEKRALLTVDEHGAVTVERL
jgi:hypothetical protein